ncbi:AraC family transcriptional regulator [Paenibacillus thalictri]|uniref:AraC family transcriptional regulator n=1 Tax=Paenibacillus thalictri TaxID=2527873 RepID=A0A4Q9DT14_9BACL|nr:AraC family transcriptional regulator [Paenibacillus thalictri]TBL79115.1 AraC family transcriptional regulator [Paenibacillus thalictri]
MLKTTNKGTLFWTNTGIVMLITCTPLILIGVILYYVGKNMIGAEVNKAHQLQLEQSIQQVDEYLTNLEKFVVRISLDPTYDESLTHLDFTENFQKTKDLYKSLSLMTESNSLISSVTLYLRDADKMISDDSGIRPIQTAADRLLFSSLLGKEQLIFWHYSLKQIHKPDSSYKAVVVKLPGGQLTGSYGAFLIYLDQTKLNGMVQKLVSGSGVAFLINEHGEELTTDQGTGESGQEQRFLKEALLNRVTGETLNENNFNFGWNDQTYSVSYGSISKLGGKWTIISATPTSQIVKPVTIISRLIIFISGVGVIIGLVLSWFASNQIYRPILRLRSLFEAGRNGKIEEKDDIAYIENQWKRHMEEREMLNDRIKQSIPALRESFLLQFLQGNLYSHTEKEITTRLLHLDWDVSGKQLAFLVAQMHGIEELGGPYSDRDSQLITFAASNILLELGSQNIKMIHVFNFQDLSVGALLVLDPNEEDNVLVLKKHGEAFISAVNNVLRMKTTVVVSHIADSIMGTPKILEQARKALRFRDVHTSNQLLDMSQYGMLQSRQMNYPMELERDIVHAVSIGLEEEAVRLVKQFLAVLQMTNGTEMMIHQGMMKLLGSIHDMIIRCGMSLDDMYDGAHLYEQFVQIHEPAEMLHWFEHKVIAPFVRALSITYDAHLREQIEQILSELSEHYLSNVSLEIYADRLNVSPSKLSKAFKQITGVNFIDYVVRLRLERCKELLVRSDMKINDIAETLNYHPSYLIRLFRKSEGMTPGQYREKHTQSL